MLGNGCYGAKARRGRHYRPPALEKLQLPVITFLRFFNKVVCQILFCDAFLVEYRYQYDKSRLQMIECKVKKFRDFQENRDCDTADAQPSSRHTTPAYIFNAIYLKQA